MDPGLNPDQERRASCLPWMFAGLLVAMLVVTLSAATSGYFLCFFGIVTAIVLAAALHYALWGRGLGEQVSGEREEEEERDRATRRAAGEDGHIRRPPHGD
jgi:hypothetical protein